MGEWRQSRRGTNDGSGSRGELNGWIRSLVVDDDCTTPPHNYTPLTPIDTLKTPHDIRGDVMGGVQREREGGGGLACLWRVW